MEGPDLNEIIQIPELIKHLGKIEIGSQHRLRELGVYATRVIKAIFGDNWCFVSDFTPISDLPVGEDLTWLAEELGGSVGHADLVVEVAERLKAKESSQS
ncbi:MAG TPA: hypothetical protein V6D47_17800 [Oscillatoriaceae cyanobacterium]